MTKQTFETLRKIDVSEHIEKKNGLSYLSWAWALDTLLLHDPDADWFYPDEKIFADATVMVYCKVTAFGKVRVAHLPVMDYKNQAIKNPNAFQTNTAMQRCLVKAIAMHGIGLYIYAGEDVPDGETEKTETKKEFTREDKIMQRDYLYGLGKCQSEKSVMDYKESWREELSTAPTWITDPINDATGSRLQGLKTGIKFAPSEFGYIDVKEAIDTTIAAKDALENLGDEELFNWIELNEYKLKALDKTLSAAKYQTPEGSPYTRITNAYNARMKK